MSVRTRFSCCIVLAAATGACGDGDPDSRWVRARVSVAGGDPPGGYQVTLARGSGDVVSLVCPEPDVRSDTERCTAAGFEAEVTGANIDVTVRSSGNAFASASLAPGRDRRIDVTPLAPPEASEDFVTGLAGERCLEDLLALSLPLTTELGESHSVKFYVAGVGAEPRVYFQNTRTHPLHYDFASSVLGVAESPTEFAEHTYSGEDRTAMAGTLIFYPGVIGAQAEDGVLVDAPWTLNFFSSDDVTPEQTRLAHRLVEERIACLRWSGREERLVYLPAGEVQERQLLEDASGFARGGVPAIRRSQLFAGITLQALNPGVAFGTLLPMTPETLATTPVSFRDVLLLSRLPNELPIVAGTITEEFQTPLAHVNVAARTRGTPNLAYPGAAADTEIAPLVGGLVRFEVGAGHFSIRAATLAEAELFWDARKPEPFVPRFDSEFTGIPSFDEIAFSDSIRVGAKAANLAELSSALGENAPQRGLAVPFRYYEAHMQGSRSSPSLCDAAAASCEASGRARAACDGARVLCLPPSAEGETLSDHVKRVLEDATFAQDTATRDAALANLRYLVERSPLDPEFASLLDARVAEVFGDAKVRVRSSTNSEDLEDFSGAGLYESRSAWANGPDRPSEVILEVFASVWSFRAFEERSYWNIDHRAVRMGCVINEAFPAELANGVIITANIADPGVYGMYVNVQKGEQSVTNPTNGALPESFSIVEGPGGVQAVRHRYSTLSPGTPLLSDAELEELYRASARARAHFEPLYDLGAGQLVLDMEFKLTPEHEIVIKQARPYTVASN